MSEADEQDGPAAQVQSADVDDFEDLFETAPSGYLTARPDGRILRVNRTLAGWLMQPPEALAGRRFPDLLNIAGKIYYETHFAPLLRMQGFFNEVALDFVRASGPPLPVLVNAVERRDEHGALRFIRITVFNATDRRRYERELLDSRRMAEEATARLAELNRTLEARVAENVAERLKLEDALRQSQKMEAVGQLTGGIAHDFNNLLTGISGNLELLQRRIDKGQFADVGRYVQAARANTRRAAALTQRLLAFARRQALDPRPLHAGALLFGMNELIRQSVGSAVTLEIVTAPDLWTVRVDPAQLENAVLNLCINARDAMAPAGGSLVIAIENRHVPAPEAQSLELAPGDYVSLCVTDSGAGMPSEVIARAFEPFYTTKPPGLGTGLGLSMVFGFVRQSGGQVRISSQVGAGTTMGLYLPRHAGAVAAAPPAALHEAAARPADGLTVLVLDDDATIRMLLAEVIREAGYQVLEAEEGQAALLLLQSHARIDLLITDVGLPGHLNGRQVADAARLDRPTLKILFITGSTESKIIGHLDAGMAVMIKPFVITALADKVGGLLAGGR